ncbi:MAG: OmpA family protein [Bacteroidales bacterium]|nr:OmpA family protein [Bacteroidales bacterium]
MKRIRFLFFIGLILVTMPFFSFSQGAMSGNGLFVASVFKENSVIQVHKFMTKELIRKIPFKTSTAIDEVKMAYSGKYMYVRQGKTFTVFDVMMESSVVTISGAEQVIFPKDAEFFYVLKSGVVYQYDCTNGKVLQTFVSPSGYKIIEIVMGENDNYFAAKSTNKVFIYDVTNTKYKKEFVGSDVRFRNDGQYFTVFYSNDEVVRVTIYKLETLYQERAILSTTLLEKESPGSKLFPTRSFISSDGRYVGLYTANGVKVEIYVFDIMIGNKVWTINNFSNTANELYPQDWASPFNMIAYGEHLMAGEYSIPAQSSQALGLRIDNFTESLQLSEENQEKNRNISNDFHYVVVQVGSDMYVRDSRLPNKKITYQGVEFICFSEDSQYMFVKKDGSVNAIVTAQISSSLQNNSSAKLYEFDRTLSATQTEAIITKDATPPKGFAFFYVNNTKQIVQVDTAKLHYTFRSMNVNDNNVELMVNIVDANGNDFIGATDPSWKYIWCNLLLENPTGSVNQVNDFVVEEVFEEATTAYALILDHSGSMGDKRANDLQFGAWDLVNHKRPQDGYLLIKYDNHVRLENGLTKEKSLISRKLTNTGVSGYGGGTALVDATYLGVKKLIDAKGYEKKVIILFTDGYENASLFSKYELLTEARANNIEINVIGFGDQVNEQYLMSLAYNTGGMYVHLYDTKDLRKVFRDIDFKRKHYYKVKFKTQVKGKHLAFLQLCQDQFKHDSLWVPFDNSVEKNRIDERDLVLPVKPKEIHLTQFNKLKIPINPVLKPVSDKKMTKEFSEIHFPNILFATASEKIISSEAAGIDEIVKFMRKYPFVFLEIHGHTDNEGTSDFNRELSVKRAEAAKNLIVKAGIAPGRVVTRGFGDTKPVASNETEEGKAKNRRIEFHIFIQ